MVKTPPAHHEGAPATEACLICYEPLLDQGTLPRNARPAARRHRLPCGHDQHHLGCLHRWFEQQANAHCPLCRTAHPQPLPRLFPEGLAARRPSGFRGYGRGLRTLAHQRARLQNANQPRASRSNTRGWYVPSESQTRADGRRELSHAARLEHEMQLRTNPDYALAYGTPSEVRRAQAEAEAVRRALFLQTSRAQADAARASIEAASAAAAKAARDELVPPLRLPTLPPKLSRAAKAVSRYFGFEVSQKGSRDDFAL